MRKPLTITVEIEYPNGRRGRKNIRLSRELVELLKIEAEKDGMTIEQAYGRWWNLMWQEYQSKKARSG
jgi:hypothetical protein